jgi:RNA polymerase subunit RPABC4/transcription elongation factor Spt4
MQAYERSLEEEALLQEIEERPICPNCRHRVENDYRLCPNCLTQLKDVCRNCDRLVDLDWSVCPYCTVERRPQMTIAGEQQSPSTAAVMDNTEERTVPVPRALG